MASIRNLLARDDSSSMTPTITNLLIVLITLVCVALLLGAVLFTLRVVRRRRERESSTLPTYNKSKSSNHRRLTITATAPFFGSFPTWGIDM